MQADVIVVAAGKGERMGTILPKPFLPLLEIPLVIHTLRNILKSSLVRKIFVVISAERDLLCREILEKYGPFPLPIRLVHGGAERQDSVRLGLEALDDESEVVAIHDAARLFITPHIFDASIQTAAEYGGAIVALPARDTVKRVTKDRRISETVPRHDLWLSQTPQTFQTPLIREAHTRAFREGFVATDDASLVEWMGKDVWIVPGIPQNFKVTTPEDLLLAEALLHIGSHI
ncbi:MAG: 2-C-methyl-D-erythritol 4-phosphate cytidylyltransferase [Candidatus Binatia bacterium]